MSASPERKLNVVIGSVTIILLTVAALSALIPALATAAPDRGPRFIAYFDDSGGLQVDDQVRVIGRRAGIVTDVGLATVGGRPKVRVEFELRPGEGVSWLQGLPVDTEARIEPGGMRSDPRLVLSLGSKPEMLEPGSEIGRTKSTEQTDLLETFRGKLVQADGVIDQAVKVIEGDTITKAMEAVRKVGSQAAVIGPRIESAAQHAPEVIAALDDLRAGCEQARGQVNEAGVEAARALAASSENTERAAGELEVFGEKLKRAQMSVQGLADSMETVAGSFESAGSKDAGRELRVMAARLRASQEMSSRDPALIGDMPSRRFWRPYFHGDRFKPGNTLPKDE